MLHLKRINHLIEVGINMSLTQLQRLELNKRVDKILHAPSNAPAGGQQLEIAFVADLSGDIDFVNQSIKDAVTALKSHDKIFQNVRSNMIYWGSDKITAKVTPMSFIQMGKAFEEIEESRKETEDNFSYFEDLCGYLKLYQARCRCILAFLDSTYEELEEQCFRVHDVEKAKESLNPFLKHRLLVVTKDKMFAGNELFMKLIGSNFHPFRSS